ncbi:hypothetical protein HQ531_10025 [bacterium]|nr:hypothetical protein [bacterium]
MKTFRAERHRKNATTQVFLTLIILLASIALLKFFPDGGKAGRTNQQQTNWESSVVKLP